MKPANNTGFSVLVVSHSYYYSNAFSLFITIYFFQTKTEVKSVTHFLENFTKGNYV